MNTNDLNTALYEKMAAEQDKFRDWLKSQPPEEVLNHAYEYTIREDIVMAMEELELTDTQVRHFWIPPRRWRMCTAILKKLETGYMDVIRDSIENRADDACRAKEELRTTPSIPTQPPTRENMGSWGRTELPTMQIFSVRKPLKRRCGNTSTECISVTMRQRV